MIVFELSLTDIVNAFVSVGNTSTTSTDTRSDDQIEMSVKFTCLN